MASVDPTLAGPRIPRSWVPCEGDLEAGVYGYRQLQLGMITVLAIMFRTAEQGAF
jgi:hypothetical protein